MNTAPDLYTMYCPRSDYRTPPLPLHDIAQALGEDRRDADPCPAVHAIAPDDASDLADALRCAELAAGVWELA